MNVLQINAALGFNWVLNLGLKIDCKSSCARIMRLLFIGGLLMCSAAHAADTILSWDANTEPDLAGYKVYYGATPGGYGTPINVGNVTSYRVAGLASGTYYFAVTAYNAAGSESGFSNEVSATISGSNPLYLNAARFKVEVNWHILTGESGSGVAIPMTSDSGYFWFFNNNNVELLVKILDGRGVNGHFWVFYGAMTNVQYTLTVTDTITNKVLTYQGQQGVQKSGNDLFAFSDAVTAPSSSQTAPDLARETASFNALMQAVGKTEATAGSTVAAAANTALFLNAGRFRVEVDWSTLAGVRGRGTAIPLTSDSGYFWFFAPTNVEILVKVLDGNGINGHFWFFWGALTDVQYTITVTDTKTGTVKLYQGQQGVQQSGNDINAF